MHMDTRIVAPRRTLSGLLAGGLALSMSGGAIACPDAPGDAGAFRASAERGAARVVRAAYHADDVAASATNLVLKDGTGNTVVVNGDGETVTITLNGEKVATKSLLEPWNRFEILGANGRPLAVLLRGPGDQLTIAGAGPSGFGGAGQGQTRVMVGEGAVFAPAPAGIPAPPMPPGARSMPFSFKADVVVESPPKVMLGITMDPPGEALASQLGIAADASTVVTWVSDELPAAKAGVKRFDVIIGVDGKSPADMATIRAALREKNPGDTISFDIVRAGQKQTIPVTLAAYEAQRLAWTTGSGAAGGSSDAMTPSSPAQLRQRFAAFAEAQSAELRQRLTELSAQMEQMQSRMSKVAGAELDELTSRMSEVGHEMSRLAQQMAEEAARRWPAIVERLGPVLEIEAQGAGQQQRFHIFAPQLADEERARMLEEARIMGRQALEEAQRSAGASPSPSSSAIDDRLRQMDERLNRMEELIRKAIEANAAAPKSN